MPAEPVPAQGTPGDVPLNWTSSTERTARALVVRLSGELDYPGRGALEAVLADALDTGPPALVVDMSGVTFCDSSSLQALLRTATRAGQDDVGFALAAAKRAVTRPIAVLGLTEQLPGYDSVESAVEALVETR